MASRYYDSSEGEIKPGRISKELRDALNIPENDLPIWIYRMRALGYPPGWLRKAVVDTSDIFDTDDSQIESSGSRKRKSPSHDEVQYDHSKLIEYPGFNSPMPSGCQDYHYYVNMPAMLEHQQLEYAKKHMNAFKPAQVPKRVRVAHSEDNSIDETNTTTASADSPSNTTSDCPRDGSPEESEPISSDTALGSKNHNNNNEDQANKSISNVSLTEGIKLVSKGSPMPNLVSRAPLEKFSEGVVGDLLYFENLPTPTGKFNSIRGLLNSIRKSKSDINTSLESTHSLQ